jgi:transcription initiation factor IIE alpha subunit
MNRHDVILQVRELLERHLTATEISQKMCLDVFTVQTIIDTLRNIAV